MNEKEKIPEFPEITEEEKMRINALFEGYLFYQDTKNGGREFWCTRCGAHFHIEWLRKTDTPEERQLLRVQHNESGLCSKCGRAITVKNVGMSKGRKKLTEWNRIAVLQVSKVGHVFVQAAWAEKDYRETLLPEVRIGPKALYRFTPEEVQGWMYGWQDGGYGWERMKHIREPFQRDMYAAYSTKPQGYRVIGMERLKQSFLRYCAYELYEKHWYTRRIHDVLRDEYYHETLLRYLTAAVQRPQLEMLVKMGMWSTVNDLVIRRNVGAGVDWTQKDPRKAFGLTAEELGYFIDQGGDLRLLRLYHRLKKREKITIQEAAAVLDIEKKGVGTHENITTWVRKIGGTMSEAIKYLSKEGNSWGLWGDYLEAAEFLKYDLTVHNVAYPKNLQKAHDDAAENRIAVESRKKNEEIEERRWKLEKVYGFHYAGYFIRAPRSVQEIFAEGKALSHCVGGYAARHAKGTVTILFLRSEKQPEKPLATIEMSGKRLVQIHGYRNEVVPCKENPNRVSARQLYAEILDPWLGWVEAGSRRDKNGKPKLPKKIKKEDHVA